MNSDKKPVDKKGDCTSDIQPDPLVKPEDAKVTNLPLDGTTDAINDAKKLNEERNRVKNSIYTKAIEKLRNDDSDDDSDSPDAADLISALEEDGLINPDTTIIVMGGEDQDDDDSSDDDNNNDGAILNAKDALGHGSEKRGNVVGYQPRLGLCVHVNRVSSEPLPTMLRNGKVIDFAAIKASHSSLIKNSTTSDDYKTLINAIRMTIENDDDKSDGKKSKKNTTSKNSPDKDAEKEASDKAVGDWAKSKGMKELMPSNHGKIVAKKTKHGKIAVMHVAHAGGNIWTRPLGTHADYGSAKNHPTVTAAAGNDKVKNMAAVVEYAQKLLNAKDALGHGSEKRGSSSGSMYSQASPLAKAYVNAALWSSSDNSRPDGGDPLDKNYSHHDIHPVAMQKMLMDANRFEYDNAGHIGGNSEQAGHDFWLTRNGHGAGFWDRPEVYGADHAKALTDAAKKYREQDL